jgi:hypothetical protein
MVHNFFNIIKAKHHLSLILIKLNTNLKQNILMSLKSYSFSKRHFPQRQVLNFWIRSDEAWEVVNTIMVGFTWKVNIFLYRRWWIIFFNSSKNHHPVPKLFSRGEYPPTTYFLGSYNLTFGILFFRSNFVRINNKYSQR